MKRRELIKNSGIGLLTSAAFMGAAKVFAQDNANQGSKTEGAVFGSDIGRNHGHAMESLTLVQIVKVLRELQVHKTVQFDIQGQSGHPHTIEMSEDHVIELLANGTAQVTSSVDFGHSHPVTLTLDFPSPLNI